MTQIALLQAGEVWDVYFDESGDMVEASGAVETQQNSKFRLQIIAGELFEDTRPGVPWLTDMVDPRVSIDDKKQILRNVILSTPGALSLERLDIAVDEASGTAEASFSGTAQNGETFSASINLA
jgi:hypothetical protein